MTTRDNMGIDPALLGGGLADLAAWEARWPAVQVDETLDIPRERAAAILQELTTRLEENYPFSTLPTPARC